MISLLTEFLPLFASLIFGIISEYVKQGRQDLHLERMAHIKDFKQVRNFNNKDTSYSRKFIVQSVIGSIFLFPMLITFLNWIGPLFTAYLAGAHQMFFEYKPITFHVPNEAVYGGLLSTLWNKQEIEYIALDGFVFLPIHSVILQTIVGFYFGSSVMKRRYA